MTEVLIVADDLTGATDTGVAFARRGYETVVRLDPTFEAEATVVVTNTESRYISPAEAAARVRRAVKQIDASMVYKKVDSTLRGNLAAETYAAVEATEADMAVVAPAFPSNGRTTACGHHLVEGHLVTDTGPGRDPDIPVETAFVPTLFEAGGSTARVGIERVASGVKATRKAFDVEREADALVCDATHDEHLSTIASAADSFEGRAVFVGSGGLAGYVRVPTEEYDKQREVTEWTDATDPAFGVVGSINPQTLTQVRNLPKDIVVLLDADRAVTHPKEAADDAASACRRRLNEGLSAVVASALTATDADDALSQAERTGVPPQKARERITDALADAARRVWTECSVERLVLTGGATATATLSALDVGGLRLGGREFAAGVPECKAIGGDADGTTVVTKAGGFGDERLLNALLSVGGRQE